MLDEDNIAYLRSEALAVSRVDCVHLQNLISAYRTRFQILELAIALQGAEKTPLPILTEYHQLESELGELETLFETRCTDVQSTPSGAISPAALQQIIDEKTASLSKLERASQVTEVFFDRIEEINKVRLAGAEGRLILLDAPSGFGKSRLLLEFIRTPKINGGAPNNYWVYKGVSFKDVRYCTKAGFLNGLIDLLQKELAQPWPMMDTGQFVSGIETTDDILFAKLTQSLIAIGTDNHANVLLVLEDTHRILGTAFSVWLRDSFVPELRQRLRLHRRKFSVDLIIVGRYIGSDWNSVESKQLQIVIPPFDNDQIREIIEQKARTCGIDDVPGEISDQIVLELDRLTAGHPRIILEILKHLIDQQKMAVVFDRKHPNYYFGTKNRSLFHDRTVRDGLNDIIGDLQSEPLREAYEVISVFRCFFGGMIRTLKDEGLIRSDLKPMELLDQLQATGFVSKPDILGFYKDHVLRRIIALDVRHKNPERFHELHIFAWKYWDSICVRGEIIGGNKVNVSGTQQLQCILEALYHFLIKTSLERGIFFGSLEDQVTAEVTNCLVARFQEYVSSLRAGIEDVSSLKRNYLMAALRNDHDLKNEVDYILGPTSWSRLVHAAVEMSQEPAL